MLQPTWEVGSPPVPGSVYIWNVPWSLQCWKLHWRMMDFWEVTGPWRFWLHWRINLMEWLGSGRDLWGPAKMEEMGHWEHAFEGHLLSPVPLCFLAARKWTAILCHPLPSWHTDTPQAQKQAIDPSNYEPKLWAKNMSFLLSPSQLFFKAKEN